MALMTTHKNAHDSLSPYERAKQSRRVARYIQQGMNLTQLAQRGIKKAQALSVAAEFGLEIKSGVGGKRL